MITTLASTRPSPATAVDGPPVAVAGSLAAVEAALPSSMMEIDSPPKVSPSHAPLV
jgi:hypothetical protein